MTIRFASLGYPVPGDVSIIGSDDIRLASSPGISRPTIRQPKNDRVARAIDILLGRCQERYPPGGACRAQRLSAHGV